MEKYYRCWKCGSITKGEKNKGTMCVMSAPYRISGICGGSLSEEISEEVYKALIEKWEQNKNK